MPLRYAGLHVSTLLILYIKNIKVYGFEIDFHASQLMSQMLHPLNSLRAFECAARHMSFPLASAGLNVTLATIGL